jgi:predicted nucleic acid-binding Zn ribbon protein
METRVEGFFEARCQELENEVKVLQFNNAEMEKQCEELSKRVNTLANRQPIWPKGYKPQRRLNSNR